MAAGREIGGEAVLRKHLAFLLMLYINKLTSLSPHSIPVMSLSSTPNPSPDPKTCSETPETATRESPEMAKEGAKGLCFLQEAIKNYQQIK